MYYSIILHYIGPRNNNNTTTTNNNNINMNKYINE